MQDLVDLNLRVPLEKEIPVTVVPEKKEGAKSADGEEEFPEITEVNLLVWWTESDICVGAASKQEHHFLRSVHRH